MSPSSDSESTARAKSSGLRGDTSIQKKMLVIILPLVVIPMLILAGVGYFTSAGEAGKSSERYLKQRENDLRTVAENPAIRDFFNNRHYELDEEAEVHRRELERSLKRFADRSNSVESIYSRLRYVDERGQEIAKVADGLIADDLGNVADTAFFAATSELAPGEVYLSPPNPSMTIAMPVYELTEGGGQPVYQGAVILDFIYPIADFRRTTGVIAWTFVIITALALAIAVLITVNRVGHLTDPIRRLAQAANLIAEGRRDIAVDTRSTDEIGRLAGAFNAMTESLVENETELERRAAESTALYEIGQEINAQVDLQPTLDLIVERARRLLGAEVSRWVSAKTRRMRSPSRQIAAMFPMVWPP